MTFISDFVKPISGVLILREVSSLIYEIIGYVFFCFF